MRLDTLQPHNIRLVVSRRNLLTLLSKLYKPGSGRTITALLAVRGADRTPVHVVLVSEPDETHYVERDNPPRPLAIQGQAALQVAVDLIEQVSDALEDDFRSAALDKLATQVSYQRAKLDDVVGIV